MFCSLTVLRGHCCWIRVGGFVLTHIWGKTERLTCFFEAMWMFPCMFLEVSKALKSNNSLLPETSDGNVALHKATHLFCCVFFSKTSLSWVEWGWGWQIRTPSRKLTLQLPPCCLLLAVWLSLLTAAPLCFYWIVDKLPATKKKQQQFTNGCCFWFW